MGVVFGGATATITITTATATTTAIAYRGMMVMVG